MMRNEVHNLYVRACTSKRPLTEMSTNCSPEGLTGQEVEEGTPAGGYAFWRPPR